MRLQHAKALRPVVAVKRKEDKETKGWDRLPLMAKQVNLAASVSNGTYIPISPPPTIHRLLNARNATDLQADCDLTYAGQKIYLPTNSVMPYSRGTYSRSQT